MADSDNGAYGRGRLLNSSSLLAGLTTGLFRKTDKAKYLHLEVTSRCNLRCIFCYSDGAVEVASSLTLDERKAVVRQARDMGVRTVSLSGGGEPLLYPDLFGLIDFIRSLDMAVTVFTNGTLIDAGTAEFLLSRQVVTCVKLLSFNPVVVDRMVGGRNAYRWVDYGYRHDGRLKTVRIPEGLKHLLEAWQAHGRPELVRIEALISSLNSASLPEVARFCQELGLGFCLETPVFTGRALQNHRQLALDREGYRLLHERLAAVLGRELLEAARGSACSGGKAPVIRANGELGFCSCRPAGVGNVLDGALKRLYRQAEKLKRREDSKLAESPAENLFFRRCRARQFYELQHELPCDY